eukprot:6489619-Amphidinium_carterae.3
MLVDAPCPVAAPCCLFKKVNASIYGGTAELQCETLAAQHAITSEAAQSIDGYAALQIYLDLTNAYEFVNHQVMIGQASEESGLLGRLALQSARSYAVQELIVGQAYSALNSRPGSKYAKFLGVLRSIGSRRYTHIQSSRSKDMCGRLKRLKWLRRGGAAARLARNAARASPAAAGLYGVAIQGVAPGQLRTRRSKLVQALVKCPRTANQAVVGSLHPDRCL